MLKIPVPPVWVIQRNLSLRTKRKRNYQRGKKGKKILVGLSKEFVQHRKEEEQEKMRKLEDMHGERKAFMHRFLNVFEKSLEKDKS